MIFACRDADPLATPFLGRLRDAGVEIVAVAEDDEAIRRALAAPTVEGACVFLGGFSRGARLAARIALDADVRGLVLLGYPFHPKGRPRERDAQHLLARVAAPSLVLQGERDVYGSRTAIRETFEHVTVAWMRDGNHRFVPRKASGSTQAALIAEAADLAREFIRGHASAR